MTGKLRQLAVAWAVVALCGCGADHTVAPGARALESLASPPRGTGYGPAGGTDSMHLAWQKEGDTSSAPTSESQYIINPGPDTVLVLKRPAPLAQDISASAVIGPEGGEVRIDKAGAKIDFPAGALREPTRVTMIAKAGWNVAYEFEPHGIQFDKPVKVQQDLKFTDAYRLKDAMKLDAAYYSDLDHSFIDPWKFFAKVTEVRKVQLDRPSNPRMAKFYVYHFSGYLMSSGFKSSFGDGDASF